MKFVKMHGLGNDFIVVEGEKVPPDAADLAKRLCDRHFGVGADGLVFVLPSSVADVRMRIFNADGSEAEQCGNAVRCVGKYAFERGLVSERDLTVETLAGLQRITLHGSGSSVDRVTVDMGAPILQGSRIPVAVNADPVVRQELKVGGRAFHFTAVSMGNPHAVIFLDDLRGVDVREAGPQIEVHPLFPKRVNVEFVEVISPEEVIVRVW
ncbi:MAG: diaminopimelate epimerase, partial [Alicyclobacillaceae bacterium]|nr:diaminopimelate epimerase [Alicyclobacillaceae bacterium]